MTVNTTEGWRELRLSVFDKREEGAPATPAQWANRVLPPPTVRIAWASMAACEQQGIAWKNQSDRLGVTDEPLSVLADGAKWIWDQAAQCWRNADWVLDVFHVSEHIHDCGKAVHDAPGDTQARVWSDAQVQSLIEDGPVRYLDDLKAYAALHEGGDVARAKTVESLLNYLKPNTDSMWYKQRLADGRPIGSGLVEGANKTIVSNRLKLNSARWTLEHAEQISALRCLDYSRLWIDFWLERTG